MAMPTEERRVVKKVVVQPDGTKKVIKKIIKKVPKTEWAGTTAPVENKSSLEESPVTWWDITSTLNFWGDLFQNQGQSDQATETGNSEVNIPESTSLDGLAENQPTQEIVQDSQITTETENQETMNTAENTNTIDLGNFDFTPGTQDQAQETVTSTESEWATPPLNMDSLLWDNPVQEVVPPEAPTVEPAASTESQTSLNLDQMISQPTEQANTEGENQEISEAFDPFMAMKTNLEQTGIDGQQTTLDLNSMTEQTDTQVPQEQASTASVNQAPTLDLNAIPSQIASNPMISNALQNIWGITADPKKKKLLTVVASCFWIFILAVIVFIRYPDMFAWGNEHGSAPVDVTNPNNWVDVWNNEPANQQPINNQWQTPDDWNTQNTQDNQNINVETRDDEIIKQKEPVIVWGDDFFDDKDIPTVILDEVSLGWSTPSGSVDPLGEVSGLIWPINGNDTIIQEALEYQEKGKALKDKWASENNRNKMRFWTFVEWKAKETIEALEKGENIDISTWISQKAQFDEYLEKGNNA